MDVMPTDEALITAVRRFERMTTLGLTLGVLFGIFIIIVLVNYIFEWSDALRGLGVLIGPISVIAVQLIVKGVKLFRPAYRSGDAVQYQSFLNEWGTTSRYFWTEGPGGSVVRMGALGFYFLLLILLFFLGLLVNLNPLVLFAAALITPIALVVAIWYVFYRNPQA